MRPLAIVLAAVALLGCEEKDDEGQAQQRQEYVSAGQLDLRGTWYQTGFDNGWGPKRDWAFSWLYLRQYGAEIRADRDNELYNQGYPLDFGHYVGTLAGDHLTLTNADLSSFDLTVSGETLTGSYSYQFEGAVVSIPYASDRVTHDILRFADPNNPTSAWHVAN